MKMKNKSIQKIDLNESSSTYVEPSFSKVTFRKRGLDNNSELTNIDEEENLSSTILDFNPTEEINQLSWPSSDPEHPKSKKKRKKNKDHHELNDSKVGNIDLREDLSLEEFKSITNSTSPECVKRKKKRKSHVSENPSLAPSPSKEYLNSRNGDEERVSKKKKDKDHHERNDSKVKNIDLREDLSLEEFKSITNSTSPECVKRKKKRKSHVSENPSLAPSPSKEYLNSRNGDEEQVSKKKRKKKKKLDVNEGYGEDVRSDKDLSMAKVEPPDLNLSIKSPSSPDVCKKKKKEKNVLEIPLLYHSQEFDTNRNLDEENIVQLEGVSESNEEYFSVSTLRDVIKKKKKKKRKKHIAEESSFQLNLGTGFKESETLEVKDEIKAKESKDSLCGYYSYLGNENTPMKKQKSLGFEEVLGVNLEKNNENFSDKIKTSLDSTFKGCKRKDSLSGHSFVEVNKETVSPLFKKKKKTQKLMDESNLNISSNEQVQKVQSNFENSVLDSRDSIKLISSDKKNKVPKLIGKANPDLSYSENDDSNKMDSENNEAEGLHVSNVSQTVQSPKAAKKKHKLTSIVLNSVREPPNDGDVIKSPETQNSSIEKTKNKLNKMIDENLSGERLGKHSKLLASGVVDKKQKKKKPQIINNNIEEKLRTTIYKEVDSNNSVTTVSSKNKQQANLPEVKDDQSSMLSPKNKNKTNSNIESLRNQLLKEALSGTEMSKNLLSKSTKLELGTKKRSTTYKKSKIKKSSVTKMPENLPSKPFSLNTGLEENLDSLRKFLLEDAISSIKGVEHLPPKLCKLKTKKKVAENVDTLRKHLLKEAITSTKRTEDFPHELSKSKTSVKEDVETLRKRLLEEVVKNTKVPEELPSKSRKVKSKIGSNIKTKRKKMLKEAITNTKRAEDLPQKSSKSKTVVEENVETLKKRLLEEAIVSTKRLEDLPPKSSKLKTGVADNSDSLRTQLLKEVNETSKVPDDLSLESSNLKAAVKSSKADISNNLQKDKKGFDNALKSKSEKKHKKNHKHKKDIDLLTNMLLSKALQKVSSSSGTNDTS